MLLLETEEFRGAYAERLMRLGVPADAVITPGADPTSIPDFLRDADAIEGLTRAQGCTAIIADSLSGGHALDENSAEMRRVLQALAHQAAVLNVPVIAVHHARKRAAFEDDSVSIDRILGVERYRPVLSLNLRAVAARSGRGQAGAR